MPRDPHPLSARFLENSVFKKRAEPPGKKTGSTEEDPHSTISTTDSYPGEVFHVPND